MKSIVMSESVTSNRYQQNNVKADFLNKVPHWLYTVFIIGIFFYLSISPIKTTLASLSYYGVESRLEQWKMDPSTISKQDYVNAKQDIEEAMYFHSTFAFYYEVYSEVLQWGRYNGFEDDLVATNEQIEALYSKSLQLRPTWPATWANVAQQSFFVKGVGDEVNLKEIVRYLNIAHQLGANTPEVHIIWADIGLQLIDLNFNSFLKVQKLVNTHVIKGLAHNKARDKIIEVIQAYNKAALACVWLKQDAKHNNQDPTSTYAFRRLKCN